MYRRVLIHDTHRGFQRILWRNDPTQTMQTFRLKTVTYGTASVPFLAIRTLYKLADDEGSSYPSAALVLKNDFYVDDVLTSGDNLQAVINLQTQ